MKYLSLFSGIGGFELGLENSNYDFECVGFSEVDNFAKAIYTRWFPTHKDLGDATKIRAEELEDFDLLVGGFPCQSFSLAGQREGFNDCRGTMFFEIARICKEKKPRYLLLENVKGLLSHDKGRTFKTMLGILSELGYDVEWEVYNSKSFSVPQNRERVYIKGYFRAKCGGEILSQGRNRTEIVEELNNESKLKPIHFDRQVCKRVNETDTGELCDFLRSYKESTDATLASISEDLGVKKSEVEHWFRRDEYFAPPPPQYWNKLKELLNIKDDKYDAYITEFEWVDGVYDMDKRAYCSDGLSPTLNTRGDSLINVAGNLSKTGHMGHDVFKDDGVSRTLNANNHKHPLLVLEDDPKVNKVGNINPNKEHQSGDVYGSDGLCRSLTATDGSHPVNVLEDEKTLKLKTNTTKGYDEVTTGDGVRLCHPSSTKARGRTQKGQIGSLSTSADWGTVSRDFRIRKLTPLECERLQAFPDGWTELGADGEPISDTQRYKCLGNAVTTTVVTYIANTMFGGYFESKGTDN